MEVFATATADNNSDCDNIAANTCWSFTMSQTIVEAFYVIFTRFTDKETETQII